MKISLFCDPCDALAYDIVTESDGYCCTVYGTTDCEHVHYVTVEVYTHDCFEEVEVTINRVINGKATPIRKCGNKVVVSSLWSSVHSEWTEFVKFHKEDKTKC